MLSRGASGPGGTRQVVRLIADDLTGAADAGVALMATGPPARIVFTPEDPGWTDVHAPVAVIDADTRGASAPAAQAILREISVKTPRHARMFMKIDSALRGNIAAEVEAVREQFDDHLVVFAAAFPQIGRCTVGGVQRVDGTPLHETAIWKDAGEETPASVAAVVPDAFQQILRLDVVRASIADLTRKLGHLQSVGGIALCDAETDEDLDAIVEAGLGTGREVLWVGSGGLAAALGRAIADSSNTKPFTTRPPEFPGTFLGIIGSRSLVARRQALALAKSGARMLEVSSDELASSDPTRLQAIASTISATMARESTVVVITGEARHDAAQAIGRALAVVVAPAAKDAPLLILSGGATARSVLDECKILSLSLVGELEPGVILTRAEDLADKPIITKAGSFGDDETLARAVSALAQRNSI